MKLLTSKLKNVKNGLKNNLFIGNKLYSFNDDKELITICDLGEDTNFDVPFTINNKSLDLIKMFNCPDVVIKSNKLIIKEDNKKIETTYYNVDTNIDVDFDNLKECEVKIKNLKIAKNFISLKTNIRPILTSINVKDNGNIYATDSFALYKCGDMYSKNDDNVGGINIPSIFVDCLITSSNDESIKLLYNENRNYVIAKQNEMTYISKTIQGEYPKLNALINTRHDNYVTYNLNELKSNIMIAKNIGQNDNGKIVCELNNNMLKCYGNCEYEVELTNKVDYEKEFHIKVDMVLMLKLLNSVNDSEENITFNIATDNPRKTIICDFDSSYKFILTPTI